VRLRYLPDPTVAAAAAAVAGPRSLAAFLHIRPDELLGVLLQDFVYLVQDHSTEDVKERQGKLTDDVDAILDEIDEVLEENAEEFVRSYVQKGGQ